MSVHWENPYENCGKAWLKGNLHAHFAPQSRCAAVSPQALTRSYSRKGYDFLGISNHLCLPAAELLAETQMLVLPGLEWNSRTPYMEKSAVTYQDHYGIYSTNKALLAQCLEDETPDAVLRTCRDQAVFSVLHHPNWLFPAHTPTESLLTYGPRLHALEIYNALMEQEQGSALATHNWDILLGNNLRVLGVVGDDAHCLEDIGKAWLMVCADIPDSAAVDAAADAANNADFPNAAAAQAVLTALNAGRFYCSTGVCFASLQRTGDTLSVTADQECRLRVVTDFGAVVREVCGKRIEWTFQKGCTYARITADGAYGAQAWTQPFFYEGCKN